MVSVAKVVSVLAWCNFHLYVYAWKGEGLLLNGFPPTIIYAVHSRKSELLCSMASNTNERNKDLIKQ